jgi:hypothetical protein
MYEKGRGSRAGERSGLKSPFSCVADPGPAFHFDADPDPTFTLMRIWILPVNLIQIRFLPLTFFSRFGPSNAQMLQNDPIRLPPFHFYADPAPDPVFQFDADPEIAFHFVWIWMRILIQPPRVMRIHVDPDPQHSLF